MLKVLFILISNDHTRKYCMSHLGWTTLNAKGLCSECGSAMLEDEDMS